MSETKKIRTHKFTDAHPYLASFLFAVALWLISAFLSIGINVLIRMVIKDYPLETGPAGTIIGTLAALLFYQFWFRPAFEGHLKGGDMTIGFRSAIPYLIYLAISFVLSLFFVPDVNFRLISLQLLFTAIAAGFIEETIFRGGLLTTLLRKMESPKRILPAALVSAAVFGIIHMANVLSGADVLKTVLQSANAFSSGLADALIYMTTGNIWLNIAVHTLHDIIAFSFDTVAENGLMLRTVTWDSWLDFALAAMLGVYSIVMLCRGDVQKHIMDVWAKKWNADKQ